jgi:transcriptional regulator with XRE-family HTH domain
MSKPTTHYGQRLRELRHASGISQIHLAEAAGVHWQTVSKIELGQRTEPSFTVISKLAATLGVPLESFLPDKPTKRKRKIKRAGGRFRTNI